MRGVSVLSEARPEVQALATTTAAIAVKGMIDVAPRKTNNAELKRSATSRPRHAAARTAAQPVEEPKTRALLPSLKLRP